MKDTCQSKKDKRTHNDLHNITHKPKDRAEHGTIPDNKQWYSTNTFLS